MMVNRRPGKQDGKYFAWKVPGKAIAVHLNLAAAKSIQAELEQAPTATNGRRAEIGGLLLGSSDDGQVTVDKFEPFDIEYIRGASYILSAKDRTRLFRRIKNKQGEKIEVVGLFRSHTRPGLFLDQYDFDLMRMFFARPEAVALLARPEGEEGPVAGFFFWEDGDIQRASSYQLFPFDGKSLEESAVQFAPEPAEPEPAEVVAPSRRAAVVQIKSGAAPVAASSVTPPTPPQRRAAVPERPPKTAVKRPSVPSNAPAAPRTIPLSWAAAAVVLAVILAGAIPYALRRSPNPATGSGNLLSLSAEPSATGVRVKWDRKSPLIAAADRATLMVTDGANVRQIELKRPELDIGYFDYAATAPEVKFRLDVPNGQGAWSESLSAYNTRPVAAPPPAADATTEEPVASTPPDDRLRTKKAPIRKFQFEPAPPKKAVRAQPNLVTAPPPEIAFTPRIDGPSLIPHTQVSAPVAFASIEPVRPSALKRAIGSIPGFGRLKKGSGTDEDFIPAKVLRRVPLSLPPGSVSAAEVVSLKVSLLDTGEISDVDLLTKRIDPNIAAAAKDTVQRWKFAPATVSEKPVASAVVIHFQFNPPKSVSGK